MTGTSFLTRAMGATEDVDESEEITGRLLAAARDVFCSVGIQRATMEDVARAAGYSRITVYRRFASKDVLVEQVVRWEFRRYISQFVAHIAQAPTVQDRVVAGFGHSLRFMRSGTSLIGALLAAEPGTMVATMAGDQGRTLAAVRGFLAGQLRLEQEAGNLAAGLDVDLVAEMMVRISMSFLVIPSELVDLEDDSQLEAIAREFVVPMLKSPA